MRLTRVTLAVAAGALGPALLLSTPSFAAGATTAVPAAAASDTAPGAGSPYDDMDINDLRIAILRILANPDSGKRVTKEANALLDDGTMEEMRTWLETGYRLAQFEDDQVAIFTIIGKPSSGRAVYAAASEALEAGTPEAAREFLATGYRLAQAQDDRFTLFQMLAAPDLTDAMRTAISAVLDDGTPEAMRHFLEVGQYEVEG
ncbi:ALF repeat-containing protein [Streptomyces sp. NBC_00670]|uniref:ALF repeat-containing protein n=1 Tax=Streptomyces sp. NBC_00670 TaxID=2975804 RepID=UPI002E303320|nr:ALF repeat-containing protein [Streptomyces sp. NBC_00670]